MDFNRVKLPREIHSGPGVIKETGSICKDLKIKGKILVASGPNTMKIAGEKAIRQPYMNLTMKWRPLLSKHPSLDAVSQVQDCMDNVNAVLGVGGGKVIDVAKMAATQSGAHC